MALFKSPVFTAVSGSVGGLNFARSRSGGYIRGKAKYVNPATALQTTVRANVAYLLFRWRDGLSDTERDGWDRYAQNNPQRGPLGALRSIGGRSMFMRCSLPRILAGLARVKTPPTIFDDGAFTPATPVSASAAGKRVTLAFDNTDQWAAENGSAMLVYIARPQNASRTFFRGSYRYAGRINGSTFLPPTSPKIIGSPFHLAVGQRVFYRVAVTRVDLRFSQTQRLTDLVTT